MNELHECFGWVCIAWLIPQLLPNAEGNLLRSMKRISRSVNDACEAASQTVACLLVHRIDRRRRHPSGIAESSACSVLGASTGPLSSLYRRTALHKCSITIDESRRFVPDVFCSRYSV